MCQRTEGGIVCWITMFNFDPFGLAQFLFTHPFKSAPARIWFGSSTITNTHVLFGFFFLLLLFSLVVLSRLYALAQIVSHISQQLKIFYHFSLCNHLQYA